MRSIRIEKDIDALRRDVAGYATLVAWSAAGIWDRLAEGPRPLAELPGDPRALELTAAIAANMGLLCREGERWRMTAAALALHASGGLRLGSGADVLLPLSRLEDVIREGGPARGPDGRTLVTEGGVREDDPARTKAFLDMLHRRSADDAEEVAVRLQARLPPGSHVLDLGGGHGRYARALVDRRLRATLFDRPVCVGLARERYGELMGYVEGDFHRDPLGGPYDAVVLSNIVHCLGLGENRALLRRVAAATSPGGCVLVKDMLLHDGGFQPDEAAAFGMTMLLFSREGRSYALSDLVAIAADASLRLESQTYLPDRGYSLVAFTV